MYGGGSGSKRRVGLTRKQAGPQGRIAGGRADLQHEAQRLPHQAQRRAPRWLVLRRPQPPTTTGDGQARAAEGVVGGGLACRGGRGPLRRAPPLGEGLDLAEEPAELGHAQRRVGLRGGEEGAELCVFGGGLGGWCVGVGVCVCVCVLVCVWEVLGG